MKVGILTFNSAHNFGAVLQCYSLYKTLVSLGHDTYVIDYRPKYLASYKPVFGIRDVFNRNIISLPKRFYKYKYWRKIYDSYVSFEKTYMKLTRSCYNQNDIKLISSDFDYIILGSDQIWNTKYNCNDSIWYGIDNNVKQITYAASAGSCDFTLKEIDIFKNKLNVFDAISVREDNLRISLQEFYRKKIETVLDPSLIGSKSIWELWYKPIIKKDYILLYQARQSDDIFRIAKILSNQMGNIDIIPVDFYGNVEKNGYSTYVASPQEFVSLIHNAKCIVTTSYHGTAFSILNQKNFYCLKLYDGADERTEYLLKQLNLSNRMIDYSCSPTFEEIDYTEVNIKLDSLKQDSLKYLKNTIL